MKYSPCDYIAVDELALQIRLDYGFTDYYLDIFKLAKNLGIILIPYSKLSYKQQKHIQLHSTLDDAFAVIRNENGNMKFYTYYNDKVSYQRQRFSIAHEIKHVVKLEKNPTDKDEDLANHFARYILAPTCLIMDYTNKTPKEIASIFGISIEAATNALNTAKNRINCGEIKLSKIESNFIQFVNEKK